MDDSQDVTVNLPAEHFDALSEAISVGLQRANISPKARKELRDWWTAEKDFIEEQIEISRHG